MKRRELLVTYDPNNDDLAQVQLGIRVYEKIVSQVPHSEGMRMELELLRERERRILAVKRSQS